MLRAYARTNVRTYEELLTSSDYPQLGNAHRGGRTDSSIQVGISRLSDELAVLVPALQAEPRRYPVIRTKRTEDRAPIGQKDRIYVYQRDNFRCLQCGRRENLTLDHIVPWSAGGSDDVDNLRTLCWTCNEYRSNFHQPDENWRPLPVTFHCVDCGELELSHPSVGPAFCWWCRHEALGSRGSWFTENNAFWDYDLNWHRDKYPGWNRAEWESAHA